MIVIVDYELGNLGSLQSIINKLGYQSILSRQEADFKRASHLILPGVGFFQKACENLERYKLYSLLKQTILNNKIPTLGICLGMQLLANSSEEGGGKGLELIPGKIKKFIPKNNERIPHIGWNEIHKKKTSVLLEGLIDDDFYFCHSYYYQTDKEYILATTPYIENFASIVSKGHIYGTQFHPEKSQKKGMTLLKNFIELC